MSLVNRVLFVFTICTVCACSSYRNSTLTSATVDNNVCTKLAGHVILYAIFVDFTYTHPWSAYDINATLESMHKAVNGIEKNAAENNIPLQIEIVCHKNGTTIPIVNNFYDKPL